MLQTHSWGDCVYINDARCVGMLLLFMNTGHHRWFIIVMFQPFYLPRKFTVILLVVVYIPPSINTSNRSKVQSTPPSHRWVDRQHTPHHCWELQPGFFCPAGASAWTVKPTLTQHPHKHGRICTAYITKCIDDVTQQTYHHLVLMGNHCWQKRSTGSWDAAFSAGETAGLATAQTRGIRDAKPQYRKEISGHSTNTSVTESVEGHPNPSINMWEWQLTTAPETPEIEKFFLGDGLKTMYLTQALGNIKMSLRWSMEATNPHFVGGVLTNLAQLAARVSLGCRP